MPRKASAAACSTPRASRSSHGLQEAGWPGPVSFTLVCRRQHPAWRRRQRPYRRSRWRRHHRRRQMARVRIAVMSTFDANGPTGNTVLSYHDSMTDAGPARFSPAHTIPASSRSFATSSRGPDTTPDIDTGLFPDIRANYSFSATADGTMVGREHRRRCSARRHGPAAQHREGCSSLTAALGRSSSARRTTNCLNGTAPDDLILRPGGADVLNGLGGNDILVGGAGSNTSRRRRSATYCGNPGAVLRQQLDKIGTNGRHQLGAGLGQIGESRTSPIRRRRSTPMSVDCAFHGDAVIAGGTKPSRGCFQRSRSA